MSTNPPTRDALLGDAALWQDVEFGSYAADLSLWEELAARTAGPLLELGAGSGRVVLHLARRGSPVVAIERDAELVAELRRRVDREKLPVEVEQCDLRELGGLVPAPEFAGAVAPLHLLQLLDPGDRPLVLRELGDLLPAGGQLAAVLVDETSLVSEEFALRPAPDMREVEGWVYSSEPLWLQLGDRTLTARRLRERVAPGGKIERSVHDEVLHRLTPEALEEEAAAAGLSAVERRQISSGPVEADSVAVILEAR